ncbi:MAG: hypothetical protein QM736_03525 [Vicinamibacterales bacterium]
MMRVLRAMMAAMALLACAGSVSAEDQRLPAFHVATPDGQTVDSQALTTEHKWLLVYLGPGCRPCETLLASMPKWQSAGLVARTVIIVGGRPADVPAWLQKTLPPELNGVRVYVDANREATTALELTGMPVLFGVLGGEIEWQLSGVLNSPSALESVVRTWVEQ